MYAHKFHTLHLGDNIADGEAFGFAKKQVTPFSLRTADAEMLFAWHVLPLDVYARNEKQIRSEERSHDGPVHNITDTTAFKLLTSGDAKVVISCMFHQVNSCAHIAD